MLKKACLLPNITPTFRCCCIMLMCIGLLSFCASSSFFISYPSQIASYKSAIVSQNINNSYQKLVKKGRSGPNHILDVLESARISQIAGDYDTSKNQFKKSFQLFHQEDNKAKLDISDGGSLLSSFALNDNTLPYQAEAYERIIAHQYQSFNYLAKGDLQGALIEVRRANEEQVFSLEQHHKELAKAEEEAEQKNLSPDISDYQNQMQENFNTAAKVKNSFQNPYTFYYSAIIREAAGEKNGAYIDLKKALELYPNNNYVQKDTWRLANELGMSDDIKHYQQTFSSENKIITTEDNTSEIIVFYEDQFIPVKEEIGLPFTGLNKIYSIAFPAYLQPWQASIGLDINTETQYLGQTNEIADIHALAAKSLEEGSIKRLLRQMIRLTTKTRIQNEAINSSQNPGIAQFLSSAYTLVSERADLRSWLTLPNKVQIARFKIPAGSHKIKFSNATFLKTININTSVGEKLIIHINRPSNQTAYIKQFSL